MLVILNCYNVFIYHIGDNVCQQDTEGAMVGHNFTRQIIR